MNHLAHAFLAHRDRDLIVGGLLADFTRGPALEALPPRVREGVALHRAVDRFTDEHRRVRETVVRFRPRWGRFAAVVTDVVFDHMLATEWARFSSEPLPRFVAYVHEQIEASWSVIPAPADVILRRLIEGEWLLSSERIEGVDRSLARIEARVRMRVPSARVHIAQVGDALEGEGAAVREAFLEFFPELTRFVESGASKVP